MERHPSFPDERPGDGSDFVWIDTSDVGRRPNSTS
jgi:hypothetical protein